MHANNIRRGRAHTITGASTTQSPLFDGYDNEDCFGQVFCPKWGCGLDNSVETFSRSRSSSDSISDSLTDDSIEGDTHLEDKHFQKALNKGVFNSVYEQTRKDRRKSFEKDHSYHHHHHHHHHRHKRSFEDEAFTECGGRMDSFNDKDGERRVRSSSFDVRMVTIKGEPKNEQQQQQQRQQQRRNKKTSKHKKLLQELSNSGINLHDTTDNLSIDEIYEMQNRFYSVLKVTDDYQRQHSIDDVSSSHRDFPCSPIRKKRSESFQWTNSTVMYIWNNI